MSLVVVDCCLNVNSLLPPAELEYLSLVGMKLLVGAFSSGFRLLVGLSRRENMMRRRGTLLIMFPLLESPPRLLQPFSSAPSRRFIPTSKSIPSTSPPTHFTFAKSYQPKVDSVFRMTICCQFLVLVPK